MTKQSLQAIVATSLQQYSTLYRVFIVMLKTMLLTFSVANMVSANTPKPLMVEFSQEKIDRIYSRVKTAHLPAPLPRKVGDIEESWANGPTHAYMSALQQFWLTEYDWRDAEQRINQFDNYSVEIEGESLHYLVEEGSGDNPTPLLLLHGWPHNFMSFLDVIKPLAHPESHSSSAQDSYTVIVVSLPGSGLSAKPNIPLGPKAIAKRLHTLMQDVLGYEKYSIQGGDWGALIASWMAYQQPEAVSLLHLNHALLRPQGAWLGSGNGQALKNASHEELAHMASEAKAFASPTATYFALQSARPQSIAYAFSDSPMGAAAWYLDKYAQWVDTTSRSFTQILDQSVLLDQIMLTLLTESMDSAMWIYNGAAQEMPWTLPEGSSVTVPTVFAAFPDPFITPPPRTLVERSYNLVAWQTPEEGGHWPMMERPDLFVESLRAVTALVHGSEINSSEINDSQINGSEQKESDDD